MQTEPAARVDRQMHQAQTAFMSAHAHIHIPDHFRTLILIFLSCYKTCWFLDAKLLVNQLRLKDHGGCLWCGYGGGPAMAPNQQ